MILRKPYAFLVKHFKLIHVLLTLVIAFLVYRTNIILNFLNQYIASNQTSPIDNLTNTMFNIWMFIFPFFIIVLSLIIISLMYVKKKPIFLYIFNIVLAVAILVFYNLAYSMFTEMEAILLEIRSVRLFRDFVIILEIFQCASLIFVLVRATGFDVKKFHFGEDLAELEIEETDNEEFEVNLEVETNEVQRKVNRFWRFTKYIYYENKFLIDIGILVGISVICFMVYMNIGIYDRDVNQNTMFSTTSFNLGITNSYVTAQDYKGNSVLKDEVLVVLELTIKSKGKSKALEIAMVNLEVGGKKFYHIMNYKDDLMDLGHTYQNTNIVSNTFEKQLLVFKIPKAYQNKGMTFTYTDHVDYISNGINSKYIRVKLKPFRLDENKSNYESTMKEDLSFKGSIFKETKIHLFQTEVSKEFRESYDFCITNNECYKSAEFIHPNYNSNHEKAILKVRGTLEIDNNVVLTRIYNLYNFIYYFGTLKYEKEGQVKTETITLSRVKPSKFEPENTYYIEVSADLIDAAKIWIDFHVRNKNYLYQIK
ncbi:MAG: hypothetical protein HFH08_01515 [Bacilli bacterium]|nr:hypothetical protein [Bacilli bacterium]